MSPEHNIVVNSPPEYDHHHNYGGDVHQHQYQQHPIGQTHMRRMQICAFGTHAVYMRTVSQSCDAAGAVQVAQMGWCRNDRTSMSAAPCSSAGEGIVLANARIPSTDVLGEHQVMHGGRIGRQPLDRIRHGGPCRVWQSQSRQTTDPGGTRSGEQHGEHGEHDICDTERHHRA